MFELIHPFALLSALAIIVPIFIHLWHKRKLKILRVGSIKFLGEGKQQQIRKLSIKNWPLFLLRCLLIISLSVVIAEPFVAINHGSSDNAGWILLGADYKEGLDARQSAKINILLNQRYELRAFDSTFQKIDTLKQDPVLGQQDYFSLIRTLNRELPANFPVLVFSKSELQYFKGDVPDVSLNLLWEPFAKTDTTVTNWVQYAWLTGQDSVALLLGSSNPMKTSYQKSVLLRSDNKPGLQLNTKNGLIKVKHQDQDNWVTADTQKFVVQVAADQNSLDERYIKAFLNVFEEYSSLPVTAYKKGTRCDFLFDLTTNGVSDTANCRTIFRYAQGEEEDQTQNRLVRPGYSSSRQSPRIYKMVVAADSNPTLWSDGFGRPLLTYSQKNGHGIYYFYSRFNPQWTDLVWSAEMMDYLMPLMFRSAQPNAGMTNASILDERSFFGQISLEKTKKTVLAEPDVQTTNAHRLFVWLLLVLLFAERIMTYQSGKEGAIHG